MGKGKVGTATQMEPLTGEQEKIIRERFARYRAGRTKAMKEKAKAEREALRHTSTATVPVILVKKETE